MPVRVNEAGHHAAAAAVDHFRAIGSTRIARGDRFDAARFNKQTQPAAQRARLSVEQLEICEHDGRRRHGLRNHPAGEPKRRQRRPDTGDEAAARKIRADPPAQGLHLRPAAKTAAVAFRNCFIAGRAGKHRNHRKLFSSARAKI